MKVRVLSDLHLECGPFSYESRGEDVLVLAGDIGVHTSGMTWARSVAIVPTIVIAGNHEHYRGREYTVKETLKALCGMSDDRVRFLENAATVVDDVRFICATLWTDFDLYGDRVLAELVAIRNLNDFLRIRCEDERFTPRHAAEMHVESKLFIKDELTKSFSGTTVVVTHHLPSTRSVHPRYGDDLLNACFASNLDDLVEESGAALWVHGHTHDSCDYMIGRTRVLCNPRGYVGYGEYGLNPNFDPNLVVDV